MRSCYEELPMQDPEEWEISGRVLAFDQVFAFTDLEEQILLYTLPADSLRSFRPLVSFGDCQAVEFNGKELVANEVNDLGEVRVNHAYSVIARISNGSNTEIDTFKLWFTSLPLLHLYTESEIQDEPKVNSWAELQYAEDVSGTSNTVLFQSYAGIEIRGRTSAQFEKLSYGLELREDKLGTDRSASLLGMRYGEDWILDAMYVDPLRMRNKVAFEIWEKMWNENSESPWRTDNPGIRSEYVELFINQRYMGLYSLSERLDAKLLGLSAGSGGNGAVMYKAISWLGGSTAFQTYNSEPPQSFIWEGWEQVYPDHLYQWEPLSDLRKSVVLDPDEIFSGKIDSLLDLECAAEYYLFVNLLQANDNIIKNYFLARYTDESPFLMVPWDLEGSLGIAWDGRECGVEGMPMNNLYKRLVELDGNDFNDLLESLWEMHRQGVFKLDSLMTPVKRNASQLKNSGAMERENRRWEGVDIDLDYQLDYILDWTRQRLEFLDEIFE